MLTSICSLLGEFFARCLRGRVLVAALLLAVPGISFASACTAMWGVLSDNAANTRLAYYNNSAGTTAKWTTLSFTLAGNQLGANALAGDSTTGLLYYVNRNDRTLHSVDLNTYGDVNLGVVPTSPVSTSLTIGATTDLAGNLYLMTSSGAGGAYYLAQINKTTPPTTATSWTTVTYTAGGGIPGSGGSGDLVMGSGGQAYLATNTNPSAVYPLTLATAKVGTSVTYAVGALGIAGIAVNPVDGAVFIGGGSTGSVTYEINPATANSQVLRDSSASAAYTINDMGNCVVAPNPPTITKTFSPTYAALTNTTTTLVLTIGNSNTVPVWLDKTFNDVLPAGLTIAATPNLTTGACVASTTVTNVITATAGGGTVSFASGGRVPAGGCTITLSVTGAANSNAYTNTIPATSLSTTAGDNAAGTTATYKVGTDFDANKSQCLGICGTTTTGVVTVPGGTTLQYVLSITNSTSGGTGSVTFTDTLPALVTPVLSITANMAGGGSCTTATAVVAGSTRITGTVTNAPAGAVCTVIVTSLVSKTQTVATNITNTLTLAPLATTSDTDATNNTATVPAIVGASALLTITKSSGVTTVTAGSTFSYTITLANLGPAAAPGATLTDPSSTGLSCSTVTCSATAGASCPASPFPFTSLSTGVQVTPTFAANSTATFVVTCGVTATGF